MWLANAALVTEYIRYLFSRSLRSRVKVKLLPG